jgi:hypothetical protein
VPGTTSPGAVLRGADFANLLGSMLADPGRQGLAAAGLAEAGLQAVPLGPQIELITAATPVPDTGSLMAFARSQGLDETTLAALFGDMAAPAPAGAGGLSATTAAIGAGYFLAGQAAVISPVILDVPLTVEPSMLGDTQQLSLTALSASELALQAPVGAAYLLPGQTDLSSATVTSTAVPAAYFLSAQSVGAKPIGFHSPDATGLPSLSGLSVPVDAKQGALSAVAVTDLTWQVTKTPIQPTLLATAAAGEVKPSSADDAMQDALRVQLLLPREAVTALTRKLANLSGNGQAQVWGNLTASAMATAGQTTLDMRQFFTPAGSLVETTDSAEAIDVVPGAAVDADTDSVAALPIDGSRKASAALGLTPEVVNPSQAAQRAENYQQLSDRLGQALAQRLQAQIERGEWKMQMRMDPASLGRIDLELQMRAGGLDAVFRSDNPLTRELIAQGLPKLRESLSQSGTAVANVWVNGDSARQSGGNPTPSQTPRSHSQTESDTVGGSGQSMAGSVPVGGVRQSGSSGAWDVLA